MAVALHAKRVGYFDRANLRDTPDVIARQVNQHHMFGTLFGVVDELLLGRLVQLRGGASRAGASQRADGHFGRAFDQLLAHQDFRARAHHMKVRRPVRTGATKVVVIHIGARVERAQRAVQAQGRGGIGFLDALAYLHLHKVAAGNHLFGAQHGGQVVGLGKVAHRRMGRASLHRRHLHRLGQSRFERGQTRTALDISVRHRGVDIHDQMQFAR